MSVNGQCVATVIIGGKPSKSSGQTQMFISTAGTLYGECAYHLFVETQFRVHNSALVCKRASDKSSVTVDLHLADGPQTSTPD
jgi:hypothetical protein